MATIPFNQARVKFRIRISILWILLVPISIHLAVAQNLMNLSIEELMDLKITTSSRFEQEQWRASAHIKVITREIIQQRGYQDLVQVLRDMPQFQVQSEHGHWTKGAIVNMRGHRSGDTGNNKFLILVDGVKISDDAEEGIYLGMNSIPLDAVAQIEIVYGPNSTIYGRDAYSGMINLITRKEDFVNAGISYGTYRSQRLFSGIQHSFENDVKMNLYFSNYRSNEQDPTNTSISYLKRTVFPQHPYTGVFARPSDNSVLNLGLSYKNFSVKYLLFDITGSESYGGNPNYYVTEYSSLTKQRNQIFSLVYVNNSFKNFEWFANYSYKRYEFDPSTANLYTSDAYRNPLWNSADSSFVNDPFYGYGGRKYYYFRTKAHKLHIKSVYSFSKDLKSISGFDFNYVNGVPVFSEGKGGKPITSEKQHESLEHIFTTQSLFSELNYSFTPELYASAGARLDMNSNSSNTLMPRLALIFKSDHHILKALYSQGYLSPSISQNRFESITTFSWIKPTKNLGPERITSAELEWNYQHASFNVCSSIFLNRLSDAILESVQTGDSALVQISNSIYHVPILQSRNEGSGYRAGIDLGLSAPLGSNLKMNLEYSFISGQDNSSGSTVLLKDNLISEHVIRARINARYKSIQLYSGLVWNSARRIQSHHLNSDYAILVDKNGFDYFPSVLLADLNLRINDLYKGLSAYLTIRNLFDKEYYGQTINAEWGSPKVLQDLRRITIGIDIDI